MLQVESSRVGLKRHLPSWGESAGSISVLLQMVAYDGQLDGLFQGAVMVYFDMCSTELLVLYINEFFRSLVLHSPVMTLPFHNTKTTMTSSWSKQIVLLRATH